DGTHGVVSWPLNPGARLDIPELGREREHAQMLVDPIAEGAGRRATATVVGLGKGVVDRRARITGDRLTDLTHLLVDLGVSLRQRAVIERALRTENHATSRVVALGDDDVAVRLDEGCYRPCLR